MYCRYCHKLIRSDDCIDEDVAWDPEKTNDLVVDTKALLEGKEIHLKKEQCPYCGEWGSTHGAYWIM